MAASRSAAVAASGQLASSFFTPLCSASLAIAARVHAASSALVADATRVYNELAPRGVVGAGGGKELPAVVAVAWARGGPSARAPPGAGRVVKAATEGGAHDGSLPTDGDVGAPISREAVGGRGTVSAPPPKLPVFVDRGAAPPPDRRVAYATAGQVLGRKRGGGGEEQRAAARPKTEAQTLPAAGDAPASTRRPAPRSAAPPPPPAPRLSPWRRAQRPPRARCLRSRRPRHDHRRLCCWAKPSRPPGGGRRGRRPPRGRRRRQRPRERGGGTGWRRVVVGRREEGSRSGHRRRRRVHCGAGASARVLE